MTTSAPPDLWVPPRFATARNPGRRTVGPAVAKIAAAMGMRPMPWQRYVWDVGGEVDDAGRFVYPLCIVTVQRQAGKTTAKQAQAVHRALWRPNRRVWDTAQTGQDARDKHRELADLLEGSPLRALIATRRQAAGSEGLAFLNGSTMRPHPPTRDALHGRQGDHNDVDEGWAFDVPHGNDLLQAIIPTQATRPGAQTWVHSTRGDRNSAWFHGLIEQGYAGVPGVALFDWSIPDDADPTDLEVIARHHPAIGHTIGIEALEAAQAALPPGEFARAYGNRQTGAGERVIPLEPWLAAQTTRPVPAGRPAYGIAVSGDGSTGALFAAVADEHGHPWVEVIPGGIRPGRSWLVDAVLDLRDAGQGVAVNRRGPAAPVADALELAGVELLDVKSNDDAAACQDFYDRVVDSTGPRVHVRADELLDASIDATGRRFLGDGGWVWKRGPLSAPAEAATLAAWAVARNPPEPEAPFVMFLHD